MYRYRTYDSIEPAFIKRNRALVKIILDKYIEIALYLYKNK